MTDRITPAERSRVMARIRSRDTGPEMRAAALLRAAGARFRRCVRGLPGTPDFVLPQSRTAVFVHGCFWHGHRACGKASRPPATRRAFWAAKFARNRARDAKAARLLRALGYSVLTVWECALMRTGLPGRLLRRIGAPPARPNSSPATGPRRSRAV